jgi:hypothetical protein
MRWLVPSCALLLALTDVVVAGALGLANGNGNGQIFVEKVEVLGDEGVPVKESFR